jgi:hypothetical protein
MNFEETLATIKDSATRGQIVAVMDTVWLVKKWFEDSKIPFTAADIIAAAALILKQKPKDTW